MQREVVEKIALFASEAAGKVLEDSLTDGDNSVQKRLNMEVHLKIATIKKDVFVSWTPYSYLLTFPTESFMKRFWENIYETWIYLPHTANEITREQQSYREKTLTLFERAVNSFIFGVILCLVLTPVLFFLKRGARHVLSNKGL